MGIRHMQKAFTLPLEPRDRFVLLALSRYASNDDYTCYPGIAKLASMTGFCEKTIQRAVNVLGFSRDSAREKRPLRGN